MDSLVVLDNDDPACGVVVFSVVCPFPLFARRAAVITAVVFIAVTVALTALWSVFGGASKLKNGNFKERKKEAKKERKKRTGEEIGTLVGPISFP
ncbi:MAG: hypothetical protein HYU99_01980 [Deltaproteobacteria bacterium]|nr:hypothetical protein [Deltaproteobacteria bacterium]